MVPDRVSNPGPLTYESGALPIALRGPAQDVCKFHGSSPYSFRENDLNAKTRHLSVHREK